MEEMKEREKIFYWALQNILKVFLAGVQNQNDDHYEEGSSTVT